MTLSMTEQISDFPRAVFFRRLAAMIYDALVAVAVATCAGMVAVLAFVLLMENGVLDMGGHEHTSDMIQQTPVYQYVIQAWVLGWVLIFFLWFWRNGGQTVGMRAWRLRIMSTTGQPLSYGRILLRLVCSLGGLGTLLVLIDFKQRQSLQDRIADTEVLTLTKEANHHRTWTSL